MGKSLFAPAGSCMRVLAIKYPSANAQGAFPIADKVSDKVIVRYQRAYRVLPKQ